jgi:Sulfotransferase domain
MYSFAQRKDTRVIDEPLYAHYLIKTNADHPGKDEVLASMETDGEKVIDKVILGNYDEEIVFMKQMTHHLIDLDESFLEKVTNIFLIRNPKQLISSLAQIIPDVTMRDTGIKRQYELFNNLSERNLTPVVIDSGQILKNPEAALTKLCDKLQIDFDENMLHWKAGPRKEDGVWAKYWYENVHKSTGFEKQGTSDRELPTDLKELYESCIPYYEKMMGHSIIV